MVKAAEKKGIREQFSLERCRKALNRHGNRFTDEQLVKIRDLLIHFAELEYLNFKTKKEHEKGHSLHPGFNR
jgi:hypothetical protein